MRLELKLIIKHLLSSTRSLNITGSEVTCGSQFEKMAKMEVVFFKFAFSCIDERKKTNCFEKYSALLSQGDFLDGKKLIKSKRFSIPINSKCKLQRFLILSKNDWTFTLCLLFQTKLTGDKFPAWWLRSIAAMTRLPATSQLFTGSQKFSWRFLKKIQRTGSGRKTCDSWLLCRTVFIKFIKENLTFGMSRWGVTASLLHPATLGMHLLPSSPIFCLKSLNTSVPWGKFSLEFCCSWLSSVGRVSLFGSPISDRLSDRVLNLFSDVFGWTFEFVQCIVFE